MATLYQLQSGTRPMIPMRFIDEWRQHAAWQTDEMVEQDLIISRVLIDLFQNPHLADTLAFRGGTAMNKLHWTSPERYSEDIDLVQIYPEPIGKTFDEIQKVLNPWLGTPSRKQKSGRANLYYRFLSESNPSIKLRLKIEINTREHFSVLGYKQAPFSIENPWFVGKANINTYHFNELMGTKLRALYQRKKGRDLFDLFLTKNHDDFNRAETLKVFTEYMKHSNEPVTRAEFEKNIYHKRLDNVFLNDITPLLKHSSDWNHQIAFDYVLNEIISHLPGNTWKGIT